MEEGWKGMEGRQGVLEENKKEWRQLGGKLTFKFPKWILQKWGKESGGGRKDEPGGGDD